jgi:hypothetical protein
MTDPEAAGAPETASPAEAASVPEPGPEPGRTSGPRTSGWRGLSRRARAAAIGGGAAVLAVIIAGAGFLAFGPVGMGPGPLSVGFVSSSGVVPPEDSTMITIPGGAAASTTAVIDAVGIRGGGGYHAPREIRVVGITGQACRGIWLTGPGGFAARCAPGGTVPLLHRAVPRHPAAATIDIGIEVGPPGQAGCWGIGRVSVHYHVGRRRYVNAAAETLSGCKSE